MKNLFKAFIAIVLFFTVAEASAQISVGPGIVYGTDINNIGISVNGKYEFNETWAAAPSFTYFLKKDYVNWSALDFDANYQITELENIGGLYAIGGLNMTFYKIKIDGLSDWLGGDDSVTGSNTGLNLGIGLNYAASEKFIIAPELKYTISSGGYLRAGVKIMFGL
jgi:opacity protein-like surface antigen